MLLRLDARITTNDGESDRGDGMFRQHDANFSQSGASFGSVQNRCQMNGFAALRLRARLARNGVHVSNRRFQNTPLEDGQGDFDSSPAS